MKNSNNHKRKEKSLWQSIKISLLLMSKGEREKEREENRGRKADKKTSRGFPGDRSTGFHKILFLRL